MAEAANGTPGRVAILSVHAKIGALCRGVGGEMADRLYVVLNVSVPVAVCSSSLVIVTAAVTVNGLGGGDANAFSSAALFTCTHRRPARIS